MRFLTLACVLTLATASSFASNAPEVSPSVTQVTDQPVKQLVTAKQRSKKPVPPVNFDVPMTLPQSQGQGAGSSGLSAPKQ